MQKWSDTIVLSEIDAAKKNRNTNTTRNAQSLIFARTPMLFTHAILRKLPNEEQLPQQQAHDQESATQSMQILDLMPKLERSVVDIEREKRGFF